MSEVKRSYEVLLENADETHLRDCESIPVAWGNGPFPCDCGVPQRIRAAAEEAKEVER